MKDKIQDLLEFLNTERQKLAPYTVEETKRYCRIVEQDRGAYCFVVREDFTNKTIGSVKKGDLLYPSTWSQPAKHPRGNLFKRETWDTAFGEWGMSRLR